MGVIHQVLLSYGVTGVPSTSEIFRMSDAEIEAGGSDIFFGPTTLTSGVAGAHGRVHDSATNQMVLSGMTPTERFVSMGFRVRFRVDGTTTGGFCSFRRDTGQIVHCGLSRVQTSGLFRVRGASADLATGSQVLALDTWYYVMLYADIDDSGSYIGKVFDETGALLETLSGSGDTYSGTELVNRIHIGAPASDTYQDHVWYDRAGAFQGCGRIETLSPTGVGASSAWSRGGTDTGANWDQVNELPKDTTSYVFSTAADQVDTYTFANRSIVGTPIAVQQVIYARAHTAGTRDFKAVCRIGGVDYLGTETFSVTSTTTDVANIEVWQNNPATGNAWTDSAIDGAEFGYKSVTTDVRIQTVAAMVLVDIA